MTSTKVTQAAGLFFNVNAAGGSLSGDQGNGGEDSFSQIMSRTVGTDVSMPQTKEGSVKLQSVSAPGAENRMTPGVKAAESESQKNQSNRTENATGKADRKTAETQIREEKNGMEESAVEKPKEALEEEEISDEAMEAVAQSIAQVKQIVMETFAISEEELQGIMETAGISQEDLLDPANMKGLVLAISGEEENLHLLMDEGLYKAVQELTAAVETIAEDLQEELQLPEGELAAFLEKLEVRAKAEETVHSGEPEMGETIFGAETMAVEKEEPQKPSEAVKANTEAEIMTEMSGTETKEGAPVEGEHRQKSSENKENQQQHHSVLQHVTPGNMTVTTEAAVHPSVEMPVAPMPDTYRIMEQVTEFMKTRIHLEDANEVQMQLQPETLGTINVRLAAREGAVTAQFTAQNEEVKAVLEAQIVQLKENLNEQGIKVEAVEVTIASHEFERNLQQDNGGNGQKEEPKKKGIRRIQLEEGTDIEEMELSEEDRIAAEMMKANGNTVDYTA